MFRYTKIVILAFFMHPCAVFGQDSADFSMVISLLETTDHKHSYVEETKIAKDQNELQHSMRYLYLLYKNYFSSQDSNQCSFHPSCSDYTLAVMRKDGLIKGGVKSLDRLTRCNSFSPEKYEKDYSRRKLIDRVD